jgi:GNAT superfamily N-acetyltransferase
MTGPTPDPLAAASVRRATPDDAAAACAVLRRSIAECCLEDHRNDQQILSAWLANKTPENLRAWFSSAGYAVVSVRDGGIVGVAMLSPAGMVTLNYLVPEARFQGLGGAMLRALEEEAARRGHGEITLCSTVTAHRFYLGKGYADTGRVSSMFGLTSPVMAKMLVKAPVPAADADGPSTTQGRPAL